MPKHQLWLADDRGNLLEILDNWIFLDYTRSYNQVNSFEIWLNGLPNQTSLMQSSSALIRQSEKVGPLTALKDISPDLLRPDRTIQIWRRPGGPEQIYGRRDQSIGADHRIGKALRLEQVGFLRSWDIRAANSLTINTALRGEDPNTLLKRRIVAYYSGEAETYKTAPYDDMMKEMVRENLGADAVDSDRDLTALSFSVQADVSAAPSGQKGFAWKKVLRELQRISEASRQLGTPLYFSVIPTSPSTFRFVTAVNRPGQDRTVGGNNPLVFGLKWGNISNAILNYSHLDEENDIYALGSGQKDDRKFTQVSDEARINASVWNRVEGTASAQENDDRTAVGNAKLAEMRPRISFSTDIHDTPDLPYGGPGGWDLGDEVTVTFMGLQFNCVIETINVRVERNGKETVRARVEYYP